jgi:RHS repeat-associated protein
LQIADSNGNAYIWDPTEPVATRPLVWQHGDSVLYYTHDGNKNVSEVISDEGEVAAHYEYAPFGNLTLSIGDCAFFNPWRFSCEYTDDLLALVYYNYRYYESLEGRWMNRDPVGEISMINCFGMCLNRPSYYFDALGLKVFWSTRDLDSSPLGNHHFITFVYNSRDEAPIKIRG